MVWIAMFNSAYKNSIGSIMVGDCLGVSVHVWTSPTSDGEGFI